MAKTMPMMEEDENADTHPEQFQAMVQERALQFATSLVESSLHNYEGDCWLEIKADFVAKHRDRLSSKSVFSLEGPSGQSWDVRVEQGDSSNQLGFKEGWKLFAYDHRLDLDDCLLFTLDDKENRFIVDVLDRCGVPKQSALCAVHNGLPSGLRDAPFPAEKAFLINKPPEVISAAKQAAEAFVATLGRPTYLSKMSAKSIVRSSLYINTQCSKEWMPTAQYKTITMVDTDGTEWPIFWSKVSGDLFGIGSGWSDFARHHKLKIGDVCLMELVEVNKRINIYVFRETDCTEGGPQEEMKPKLIRKVDLQKLQLRHTSLYQKLSGNKKLSNEKLGSTSLKRPSLKAPRSQRLCKRNTRLSTDFLTGMELDWQDFGEKNRVSPRKRDLSEILALQPTMGTTQVQPVSCRTSVETTNSQSHEASMSRSADEDEVRQEPSSRQGVRETDSELPVTETNDQIVRVPPTNIEPLRKSSDVSGGRIEVSKRSRSSSVCDSSIQGRKRSQNVSCSGSQIETDSGVHAQKTSKETEISGTQQPNPSGYNSSAIKAGRSPAGLSRAMKAANDLITRHPRFILCMSTGDWRSTLPLPQDFTNDWIRPEASELVILVDSSDKHWGATLRIRVQDEVQRAYLQEGWRNFVCAQELEEGDACVFELINAVDITFQIHVFRLAEVTKVPVQTKEPALHHTQAGLDTAPIAVQTEAIALRKNVKRVPGTCLPGVDRPDPLSSSHETPNGPRFKLKSKRTGPATLNFFQALQNVRAGQARKETEVARSTRLQ